MTDKHVSSVWRIAVLVSVIFTLITAWNSSGYHYFDEHYQLIEFARLKLGYNTPEDMPWEYNSAARSTVQPTICMVILQVASFIGIHDPHHQAAILRIISGMIAVAAISFFLKKTVPLVEKKFHIAYILLSYFLWFIPYNSVRFSSETWSALAFLVAVGLCINVDNAKRKHVLIGALLGISFVFRFQTAILSGGLVLWLIFIERENKIHLVKLIATAITVAFIGLCVDFWFYSRFTFSFWNYFMANLIEGKVNNFGVSPWHDQFRLMLFGPIYPIGVCILVALAILLIKTPKNVILWCVVPFLIVHTLIPHKELRFLFPLIYLVPLSLVLAFKHINNLAFFQKSNIKYIGLLISAFLISINAMALLVMAFKPADAGQKDIVKYISANYPQKEIFLFYTAKDDPYNPILPLKEKFYENNHVSCNEVKFLDSLIIERHQNNNVYLLCTRDNPYAVLSGNRKPLELIQKKIGIPYWMQLIADLYSFPEKTSTVHLYELKTID